MARIYLAVGYAVPDANRLAEQLRGAGHNVQMPPRIPAEGIMDEERASFVRAGVIAADTVVLYKPDTDARAAFFWAIASGKRSIIVRHDTVLPPPPVFMDAMADRIVANRDALLNELARGWRSDVEAKRIADEWCDPNGPTTGNEDLGKAIAHEPDYEVVEVDGYSRTGPWWAVRVPSLPTRGTDPDVRLFASEIEAERFARNRRDAIAAYAQGREVIEA